MKYMSIKKNGIYWKGIKRRIGRFFEKVHEGILIFTDWLGYVHIVDRLQNIEIIGWKQKEFYFAIGRNRMQRRSSSTPQTLT